MIFFSHTFKSHTVGCVWIFVNNKITTQEWLWWERFQQPLLFDVERCKAEMVLPNIFLRWCCFVKNCCRRLSTLNNMARDFPEFRKWSAILRHSRKALWERILRSLYTQNELSSILITTWRLIKATMPLFPQPLPKLILLIRKSNWLTAHNSMKLCH